MIKNVQLKRVNKILDVDYHNHYDLISSVILLFVFIKVCDLVTSSIRYICIYYIHRSILVYCIAL